MAFDLPPQPAVAYTVPPAIIANTHHAKPAMSQPRVANKYMYLTKQQATLARTMEYAGMPTVWKEGQLPIWSFEPNAANRYLKDPQQSNERRAIHAQRRVAAEIADIFTNFAEYQRVIGDDNRGSMNDSMWKCPQHQEVNPLERHTLLYDWGSTKR